MQLEETGVRSHLRWADLVGWQGDDTINSTDEKTLNIQTISEGIGKDVEGNGYGLIWGTNPESAWRNWGKLWNTSISLSGIQAGILIQDLLQWSKR